MTITVALIVTAELTDDRKQVAEHIAAAIEAWVQRPATRDGTRPQAEDFTIPFKGCTVRLESAWINDKDTP